MSIKNNTNPFKRSSMLVAAINALSAMIDLKTMAGQIELNKLFQDKEYQSRGKGGGGRPHAKFGFAGNEGNQCYAQSSLPKDKILDRVHRSHNGAQEIARRLRSSTPRTPARRWYAVDEHERTHGDASKRKDLVCHLRNPSVQLELS
jgi:hypothetical protein